MAVPGCTSIAGVTGTRRGQHRHLTRFQQWASRHLALTCSPADVRFRRQSGHVMEVVLMSAYDPFQTSRCHSATVRIADIRCAAFLTIKIQPRWLEPPESSR